MLSKYQSTIFSPFLVSGSRGILLATHSLSHLNIYYRRINVFWFDINTWPLCAVLCCILRMLFIGIQFYFIIIYCQSLIESFVSLINQWPSRTLYASLRFHCSTGNYMTITPTPTSKRCNVQAQARAFTSKTTESATAHTLSLLQTHKHLFIFGSVPKTQSPTILEHFDSYS